MISKRMVDYLGYGFTLITPLLQHKFNVCLLLAALLFLHAIFVFIIHHMSRVKYFFIQQWAHLPRGCLYDMGGAEQELQ